MARRNGTPAGALIAFLVFAGFCGKLAGGGSDDSLSTPQSVYTASPITYPTPSTPAPATDATGFYAHGTINVRSGPGRENGTVRTLSRGDYMRLGDKDARGWAPLYDSSGVREGYVYRASDAVRASPPRTSSTPSTRSASRASSSSSSGYYTGPRGGCYTYSGSGRKRYVDRSYCN